MIKEILEGLTTASLVLSLTVISLFSEDPDEEPTEIIHVWTFVDKTFDDDETILVDGTYGKRIQESTEVY